MPTDIGNGVATRGATGDGGARGPRKREHAVEHTFAMDSPGPGATVDAEMGVMRSVDRFHQRRFGRHGIGYAEVATDAGRVYEGRGPGRWLAHARGLNDTAYGFGHMGHGNKKPRAPGAWRAGRALHPLVPPPRVAAHVGIPAHRPPRPLEQNLPRHARARQRP
jgi:hypothetical protein